MDNHNKRVIICFPDQPNLYGVMTLENAKSLVEEKSLDKNDRVLIVMLDNNSDVITCLEREDDKWKEKESMRLNFS